MAKEVADVKATCDTDKTNFFSAITVSPGFSGVLHGFDLNTCKADFVFFASESHVNLRADVLLRKILENHFTMVMNALWCNEKIPIGISLYIVKP